MTIADGSWQLPAHAFCVAASAGGFATVLGGRLMVGTARRDDPALRLFWLEPDGCVALAGPALLEDGRRFVFPVRREGALALKLHDPASGEWREMPSSTSATAPGARRRLPPPYIRKSSGKLSGKPGHRAASPR